MKFLASTLAVVAMSALQIAASSKCLPQGCYIDYVGPDCPPDTPCPAIAIAAKVCPWKCGEKTPANCTERCKPCKSEICPAICVCELVCPLK
ncbi:hypothetical protein LPJ75_004798 [Coemansia sp. RSA 2598]|nr:hypothetical protein LPJ75_006470 [Coemansia sp. RSA 2598]KAJ1807460.1 hypothetical protein LPJ75_004798 [Coemansia sp. RSA 2598]